LRCPDRSEVKPFEFHNNSGGFTKLWDCVIKPRLAEGSRGVVIGLESTGAYAKPLTHFFKDKPVRFVQVNSLHTFLSLICNLVSKGSLFVSRC
jgi:transposase